MHGLSPRLDRGVSSDLDVPYHLHDARTGFGRAQGLTTQHGARRGFSIKRVTLALLVSELAIGPVNLDDGMSPLAKEAGQGCAVAAGSLDAKRPD